MTSDIELAFHRAMVAIYDRAKREANYSATRFVQMVASQGGLKTARQLLHADTVSDGFTSLWEAGRLDLSVEAHVLLPEYVELFTEAERRIARGRLAQYGYAPPA